MGTEPDMTTSVPPSAGSELLEVDAEIQRIAKLLGVAPAELEYLRELPSPELRGLRDQVTATLFDSSGALSQLASATKLLPAGVAASLAEKHFGPMLTARIAGLVDVDRAVDIAARLPTSFLAQVGSELDPRRVASILAKIPAETIAAVAAELIAEEQWVAMGTFYGFLPDASIAAAMGVADAHALLQISLMLDDKSRLANVLAIAGSERLDEVTAAAEAAGLTEQFRALEVYLTPAQQTQLAS
jgi:hypothetical protein